MKTDYTEAHLEAYRQHLIADYKKMYAPDAEYQGSYDVTFEPGKKYTKVVAITGEGVSRSSHSFIDAQGNIWKAASWKTPAKNFTRGSILDGTTYAHITWAGGF